MKIGDFIRESHNINVFIDRESISSEIDYFSSITDLSINYPQKFGQISAEGQIAIASLNKVTTKFQELEDLLKNFSNITDDIIKKLKEMKDKASIDEFERIKLYLKSLLKKKRNPSTILDEDYKNQVIYLHFKEIVEHFISRGLQEIKSNDEEQLSDLFKHILQDASRFFKQDNFCKIFGGARVFKKSIEKKIGADLICVFRIVKYYEDNEIRSDITKLILLQAKDSRAGNISIKKRFKKRDICEISIQPNALIKKKVDQKGLQYQVKNMLDITSQCGVIVYDISNDKGNYDVYFIEPREISEINIISGRAIDFSAIPFVNKLHQIPECTFGEIWNNDNKNSLKTLAESIDLSKPDLSIHMYPN